MYGETSRDLRAALIVLARQHRIQHRLGGRGHHLLPESTTVDERRRLGEQIGRYRHGVMVWCLQAVRASNPERTFGPLGGRPRGPGDELELRLGTALDRSAACLPPLAELVTEQAFTIVELWRQAARAAALGEHDFPAGVGFGRLSDAESKTVLKDAATVVRAIVVLDRRYSNIPGWRSLTGQRGLELAAERYTAFAGHTQPDFAVDLRGWRPTATAIDEPAKPGLHGVLQAERNLLAHLDDFPNAHSLRIVLASQRIVSHVAADLVEANAPERAARWRARSSRYHRLVRETRDLGGELGNGALAAGQGSVALARVQRLHAADLTDPSTLSAIDRLFVRVDERIGHIIERGAKERLYFLRVALPQLEENAARLVKPTRERYVPVSSPVGTGLVTLARQGLLSGRAAPAPPRGAEQSRADLEAAIIHRPPGRPSVGELRM